MLVNTILSYFRNVRAELEKVEWPKLTEVIRLSIMVVLITAIVGAYVGGLDLGFTKLLELVIETR